MWRLLWDDPRSAAFDVSLVVAVLVFGKLLAQLYPPDFPQPDYSWMGGRWVSELVATWLSAVLLLLRRRFALELLVFDVVLMVVHLVVYTRGIGALLPMNQASDPWIPGDLVFVLYAFAAYETGRRRQIAGWVLAGVAVVLATRWWANPDSESVNNALFVTVFPPLLGAWIGARRRLVGALRDRAERAEREQRLLAEQARADERSKMAAEMHDVVTHRVSLMVLQAGALGVTAQDPETRAAAEELRAGGAQALDELRDFIGVLRSGGPGGADGAVGEDGAGSSGLPDLSGLIAETEAVGIPVRLVERGRTAEVAPMVSRTAHRVVQEALTNVHKHAPGSSVEVRVDCEPEQVRLSVRNTASGGGGALAATGSGAGLSGLRQRVELVGGTFRAGPLPEGGFEVAAVLPTYVPTGSAG